MPKFVDNLALLFIALKLAEIIDWSWWLVLSPVLFSMAAGAFVAFLPAYRQAREQREWNKLKEKVKSKKVGADADQ